MTVQEEVKAGEDGKTDTSANGAGAGGEAPADTKAEAADGAGDGKSDEEDADDVPKPEEEAAEDGDKKPDEDGDKSEEKDEAAGAPDEYVDFKIPEGAKIDEEMMSSFTEFARGNNLSQEQAQAGIDLHVSVMEQAAIQQQEQWDAIKEGWRKESFANKALHDSEGKPEAAMAASRAAAMKLGGEKLIEVFDLTGAGDHPAVVEAFFNLSKLTSEDDFVFGSGSADTRTTAEKMYPSMKRKK